MLESLRWKALWLAAGGDGWVSDANTVDNDDENPAPVKYKSSARILLVGSGVDEQCAGWLGLPEEIKLDMQRIWKRNLGRDDRRIADNGKEATMVMLASCFYIYDARTSHMNLKISEVGHQVQTDRGSLGASVEQPCMASRSRAQVVLHAALMLDCFLLPRAALLFLRAGKGSLGASVELSPCVASRSRAQVVCCSSGYCATAQCAKSGKRTVLDVLSIIKGPWAIIYWQDGSRTLWFGRDAFGRRSLLVHWPTQDDSTFLLSSISPIFPTEQTFDQIDLLNASFDVQFAPDRISSKAGLKELKRVAPSRRLRLVEIDSELSDLVFKTNHVMSLINPANTYMDLNIGIALWLAADGDGWVSDANTDDNDDENPATVKYKSSARILLVGSGADEQCAGGSLGASVELSPCVASRSRAQVVQAAANLIIGFACMHNNTLWLWPLSGSFVNAFHMP
ncbi:hypothetical protein PIB30_018227 [Stylosanthes scabra]|uniref:Uncharacterized protein n=1 Tax=Stylosanthes scabra TaxID=79078 RepID=A0ABU6V826_9FABA|nr:hypothetical protein [Stylosanthes scabra]